MSDRIRIKDIALRAGVSVGTVDRVIHNRANVSKKAVEKVREALEEMDYQPNMYASALAYNKKYLFILLIPKHDKEAYWDEVELKSIPTVSFSYPLPLKPHASSPNISMQSPSPL